MYVYLRAKFEFSSLILTSFRYGGGGGILPSPSATSKRTAKKPTQINNQLSKHVTSAFKICYNQIDSHHKKIFYWGQNLLGHTKQLPSFRMYKRNQQKEECKTNKYIQFFYIIYKDTS